MRRPTAPSLLRALLLGSLGLTGQGCGGREIGSAERGDPAGSGGSGGIGGTGDIGGAGGVGTAGKGGMNAGFPVACVDQTPLVANTDTGFFSCAEGLHRKTPMRCPSISPRDLEITFPPAPGDAGAEAGAPYTIGVDECRRDADCGKPNAFCFLSQDNLPSGFCGFSQGPLPPAASVYSRRCSFHCAVDSDCAPAEVCVCNATRVDDATFVGACTAISAVAGCHSDLDCKDGALCLANARDDNFGDYSFACQLPGDACEKDSDCGDSYSKFCSMSPTGRVCKGSAVCGRPFWVEGAERLAEAVTLDAWATMPAAALDPLPLGPGLAARLAEHWTAIALMEHASVAAFARFTLQLLCLGAPPELVQASSAAQCDELRHAQIAFSLATRYGGSPVGPSPLPIRGALLDSSPAAILRTTIIEGCIGETRAALEAAEAARLSAPGVRAILLGIAADESRHAELAWTAVRFILTEHPELVPLAHSEFARAETRDFSGTRAGAEAGPPGAPFEGAPRHGLLNEETLARVKESAWSEVISPCAAALLEAMEARLLAA